MVLYWLFVKSVVLDYARKVKTTGLLLEKRSAHLLIIKSKPFKNIYIDLPWWHVLLVWYEPNKQPMELLIYPLLNFATITVIR